MYLDKTGNGYNLTGTASPFSYTPVTFEYRDLDNSTRNVNRATLSNAAFIPAGNSSLFHNDHELHYVFAGRMFSTNYIFGTYGGTNARTYAGYIDNNGKINITMLGSLYRTTNAIFRGIGSDLRRVKNKTYLRLRVDFTNDELRLWINGGEVPLTLISGSGISSMSPTGYDQSIYPFPFGAANNANSSVGIGEYYTDSFYAAITDLLSTQQFYRGAKWLMK